MSGVALSISYLPNVHYFTKLLLGKDVFVEACETYPKQTYRNRCEILGANGLLTLSVPIVRIQGNHTPVTLVEIDNSTLWQKNHWRAIVSAYRKAVYFEFVADVLAPHYSKRYSNLFELDHDLLKSVLQFLGESPNLTYTNDFVAGYDSSCVADFRNRISPKVSFEDDLNFAPAQYFQVFSNKFGFVKNLSIADLLFNEGLNAVGIIKQSIV